MTGQDRSLDLQQAINSAIESRCPLNITGGNSKSFYGRVTTGLTLSLKEHRGIVNYQPSELVLTARAGTPLSEIEHTLSEQGQMLGFEPPYFGEHATLGGTVACALSGPRRPFTGSVRDFVLGCKIINGKGEKLSFGGEVMKNVAGFDVSRLMAGALGTLGVLLEISLKVLPLPAQEMTLCFELNLEQALAKMNELARRSLPVSGQSYDGSVLHVRLSGSERAVLGARARLGGEMSAAADFWQQLNEHRLPFFQGEQPLWRISVPPASAPLALSGTWLYDWGGSQRWLRSEEPARRIFEVSETTEGHAILFRGGDRSGDVFQPESGAMLQLNRNLKQAFDPYGIFNPGKRYKVW
ncbi:MAG: glycolate oxidase subunit GlcE [Gammaproteobacteria bacterium]